MTAEYPIIDGDGHVMEPNELWRTRMDRRKWGEWIPHQDPATERFFVGGEYRSGGERRAVAAEMGIPFEIYDAIMDGLEREGGKNPRVRIADMDADGIDAAVLYPSSALFFGPLDPIAALRNPEFVRDCQRAYNDWLAEEYCGSFPGRLFGMALVPLQAVDLAVEEARRAIGDKGLRGVCIRPSAYVDELPLNHPVYDPFWAAMQELDAPVAFHPGVHVDTPGACRQFRLVREDKNILRVNFFADAIYGGSGLGQAVGNMVDMVVTVGRMLMGGVCERFPRLRLVFLEAGGGWIGTLLERMDEQLEAFPAEGRHLSLLPSEYFRRQCWIGFEADEWNLVQTAELLGADRILWASDYPHPEYRAGVVERLKKRLAPLPPEERRKILSGSAIEAYQLPLAARPG
ncbi:MAG: amidohydrolase family protein [Candidatus Binatia bacterium]